MTGDQLSSQLGFRLEDTGETLITKQQKVDAINNAINQVVTLVDNIYLSELETSSSGSVSSGQALYSDVFGSNLNPARSSIVAVRDYSDGVDGKWFTIQDVKDIKTRDNVYLAGTSDNPICQIFAESFQVQPTTINQIKVWFYKVPTPYDYTDASSMATECVLNRSLEGIVLDFAESELWRSDGRLNRASGALQNGMSIVQVLNGRLDRDQSVKEIN